MVQFLAEFVLNLYLLIWCLWLAFWALFLISGLIMVLAWASRIAFVSVQATILLITGRAHHG